MNQILSVENVNKKKGKKEKNRNYNGSAEEKKIIRFFAIALIIFGIFNIGTGAFAMYKNQQERANKPVKPVISIEQTSEEELTLKVSSEKNPINEIYYSWNDEEEEKINGNNQKEITKQIKIPEGDNTLYVRAINTSGQTQALEQRFVRETKISIQIETADPNLLIRVEGKEEIAYITYSWNDGEEQRIEVNSNTTEQYIEAMHGENTLKVTAVDINNESKTIEQPVKGIEPGDVASESEEGQSGEGETSQLTTKPSLKIEKEENKRFLIYAKDDVGLKRIELIVNGNTANKITLDLDGRKEQNFDYPIEVGENSIEVTIYNLNDEKATQKSTANRTQ